MIRELLCYQLVCDGCGRAYQGDGFEVHEPSAEEARAGVQHLGWTRDGDRDLCPACSCAVWGHQWRGPCWRPDPADPAHRYCARCEHEEPVAGDPLDEPVPYALTSAGLAACDRSGAGSGAGRDWGRLATALARVSIGVLLAVVVLAVGSYATDHPALRVLTVALGAAGLAGLAGVQVASVRAQRPHPTEDLPIPYALTGKGVRS